MTARDWTRVDWRTIEPLIHTSQTWWTERLQWDTREAWYEVRQGHAAARVPGAVAIDDTGTPMGLAFGVLVDGVFQLGPVLADSAGSSSCVLSWMVARARGLRADASSYFGPSSPHVDSALRSAGFEVEAYRYLARALDAGSVDGRPAVVREWRSTDQAPAAELLRRSYGSSGRYFASHGLAAEWSRYVDNLIAYTGCGRFEPQASGVAERDGRVSGASIVTSISQGVAHVAQLAVDPAHRRRGIAASLLDRSMERATRVGCHSMTLLVDSRDDVANRLYESRGFAQTAVFSAGWLSLSR